ncbi:MAG TPA: hypothetical protein VHU87_11065 [Rhizomicrobium sp.]|jgi:hypothetical protein|nr:hypothetical protein [Rhizomicrobium sp.]
MAANAEMVYGVAMNKRVASIPNDVSSLPIEDDEQHGVDVDSYVARNRDALNVSIQRSRKEVAAGQVSSKTMNDIVAEGRQRRKN